MMVVGKEAGFRTGGSATLADLLGGSRASGEPNWDWDLQAALISPEECQGFLHPCNRFGIVLDPVQWARQGWARLDLGDKRLNKRAVEIGAKMAANPEASLPKEMGNRGELRQAYGLLNNQRVTMGAILAPQCHQTLEAAGRARVVLMVEDSTELDFTGHPSKTGLGPIGDGKGKGIILHSTLAVEPNERQVLGLAHAEAVLRQAAGSKRTPRYSTPEARVWEASARAIGSPPKGVTWVHVGDRESDIFEYMVACLDVGKHFLVRAYENRALWGEEDPEGERQYLISYARNLAPCREGDYWVQVPANRKKRQSAREAHVVMQWAEVKVGPPKHAPAEMREHAPISVWILRVWEPDPPEGKEAVEWILLSSLPITTVEEAQERISWYTCRWLCEDYHQCLKTGCRIESNQLDDGADIMRLLGFCCPIAVHLLQVRQAARSSEQLLAREVVEELTVQVLAEIRKKDWRVLTIGDFYREVGAMGGHQGRKSDGPPGWRTLWWGWSELSTLVKGARLFASKGAAWAKERRAPGSEG